jgi:flagellar protein FlaI
VLDLNLSEFGARVAAIGRPLSPEGLAFTLRRHKTTPWTLPQFVRNRSLTPEAAGLLSLLVDSQASILIAGSRGAGKTSLLGGLMLEIPQKFRIISIEDTLELPISRFQAIGFKIQSLHVQSATTGSEVELRAEDALRAALRLGESVLVIGEVRGAEAKVLYEAMRIGAAGNSVMGTIHGATTRDVFERVVYDLGIPPTSFKATDAIVVAAPIRPGGSVSRVRRVVQITEVGKDWKADPMGRGGFADLMIYNQRDDQLKPTKRIRESSQLVATIARKWGIKEAEVMNNLELRARVQWALVKTSAELNIPKLLEAEFVVSSNNALHQLLEEQLQLHKVIDYNGTFQRWHDWLKGEIPG